MVFRRVQQVFGAGDVDIQTVNALCFAGGDVVHGGQMQDSVRVEVADKRVESAGVANVAVYCKRGELRHGQPAGKVVQHGGFHPQTLQLRHHPPAYHARAARYQNPGKLVHVRSAFRDFCVDVFMRDLYS